MSIFIKNIPFLAITLFVLSGCVAWTDSPKHILTPHMWLQDSYKDFYTLEYVPRTHFTYHDLCQPNILIEIEPPLLSKRLHQISPQIAFEEYDSSNRQWQPLPNAQWSSDLSLMLAKALVRSIPSSCLKTTRIQNPDAHFRLMSFLHEISVHSGIDYQGAKAVIAMEFRLLQMPEEQIAKTWRITIEEQITNIKHTPYIIESLNKALNGLLSANLTDVLTAIKKDDKAR